jgi:ADP-ribose pyrophosphatase YjhB (NUDIX family)
MGDKPIPNPADPILPARSDKKSPARPPVREDHPRPSVAVDTALLTRDPDRGLVVLQVARPDTGKWALPGTFLRDRETLAEAVERSLRDKAGVHGIKPHQLQVFDHPNRDERDWILSVAHVAVVRPEQLESLGSHAGTTARLVSVDRPGEMVWDHDEMVRLAKRYVRTRYQTRPDPERLLGSKFTLRELQKVHEEVEGRELTRDQFRRRMENLVEPTGIYQENTGTRGRPAEYFRRKR